MPSESPLIKELDNIKVGFEKLSLLIQQNCKRASIFYTSPVEIGINDFCQDQVKPILNELKVYLECFRNLFQRDIKEMKDVFESTECELDELEKQNELLKDQLLAASLKHDVELCVLINHKCVDKILNTKLEKVKKKSFEIQEDLQARIKILEKDFGMNSGMVEIILSERYFSRFKNLCFDYYFNNQPVFSIWKAFGGNTSNLGSFGEETDKTTKPHQHLSRISTQKLETASQITRDAVTTHLKTASQDLQTTSDCTTQPII
ncbi:hypothetical protein Tco_0071318 [Tanacetum coccineum]